MTVPDARALLQSLAKEHAPEETDHKAIIDQWLSALVSGNRLYCDNTIQKPLGLRRDVIAILEANSHPVSSDFIRSKYFDKTPIPAPTTNKFTFIDLFCGVGGFRIAMQNAGGQCVFSSDLDSHARQAYEHNYDDLPFGDITKILPRSIPTHDVLVAGFPCQPFSRVGEEKGFYDTRGTLFHNIMDIVKTKRPKMAILENVKGLISNDKGNTIVTILRTMLDAGYACNIPNKLIEFGTVSELQNAAKKEFILNAREFGLPQHRPSVYMVFWRVGLVDKFEYPRPTYEATRDGSILEENPADKLTLTDGMWNYHQRKKQQDMAKGNNFGYCLVNADTPYTETILARYYKDGAQALIEQPNKNPRLLSPREAARLQGFPEAFEIVTSNPQAYKQFGNSVPVSVVNRLVAGIAKVLYKYEGVTNGNDDEIN